VDESLLDRADLSFPDDVKVGQAKIAAIKFFTVRESDALCSFWRLIAITDDWEKRVQGFSSLCGN
jgi:hypothetical protein